MPTVALVGPDGAGKSSIARQLTADGRLPISYLYMGVNLEASTTALPTTRLALWLKRRRGGRPDMTASNRSEQVSRSLGRNIRESLRLLNWIAEEWYRQLIAWHAARRGRIVLFDRHFLADYHAHDIGGRRAGKHWMSRVHGRLLARYYPRPDLVIVLDAAPEVLRARKPESSLDYLQRRRAEYRSLSALFPLVETVDAAQPMEAVLAEIYGHIERVYRHALTHGRTDTDTRST